MGTKKLETEIPLSFEESFSGNFLGDPDVVNRLVSSYATKVESLIIKLWSKELDSNDFESKGRQLTREYADIFAGRNDLYTFVKGYNDFTLPIKLKADLGEYWQRRRADWNDDSVCVLFEWLAMIIFDKMKIADGDDMLFGVMIKPSIQYTVQVLLGIEQRVRP
jgi:hypothetical protein